MGRVTSRYETNVFIAEYDIDMYGNLRMSGLLRHMQEVGSLHLESFGFSYETIAAQGCVYLMVNMRAALYRPIKSHETIRFLTWVPKSVGIRTYRNFKLCDTDGKVVGEASTVWVLANVATHKITTLAESPIKLVFDENEKLGIPDAKKVKMPKNMPETSTRKIRYSDLDVNAHVNNSIYADIFCDESDIDFSKYWINDLSINYRKEALFGDNLSITSRTDIIDGVQNVYMVGLVDSVSSFEVLARLSEFPSDE